MLRIFTPKRFRDRELSWDHCLLVREESRNVRKHGDRERFNFEKGSKGRLETP
jgi:hypothetical protein